MVRKQPAETESTEPTKTVRMAHFKTHEGRELVPGDVLTVPEQLANSWVWGGIARLADPAPAADTPAGGGEAQ